jgi:arsenite-transporting ATPase
MSGYIVNRIIPPELKEQEIPAYLLNRIVMQEKYMDVIKRTFGQEILAYVPEMERDITGLDMIEKVAQAMFGDGR